LRSVLSYLSPFRSSSKTQKAPEEQDEPEDEEEDADVKGDESDSADEAAHFALHGREVARESSIGIVSSRELADTVSTS